MIRRLVNNRANARRSRPGRGDGGVGGDVRPGEGCGRDLPGPALPRRPLRDRVRRPRAGSRPRPCARRPRDRGRGARRRAPRGRLRPPDARARADERLERRLRHRDVRRPHAPDRARPLPTRDRRVRLGRRRARDRRPRDARRRPRRLGDGRPARARRRRRVLAPDRPPGTVRAALRPVRVHARRAGGGLHRARRRRRAGCRRPPRLHRLGRARRHRCLRERARVPRPDVGAAADERDADSARLHPRAGLGRALRLHARGRPARRARVERLRGDHGGDRPRRARGGRGARPPRAPPERGMTVVLLSLASAATFGAMTVALRIGLRGGGSAPGAALSMLLWGTLVSVLAALPSHDLRRSWQFLLAGCLAPGCSQVLLARSVREAGPSRTSATLGAAPLVAVAIAFAFLGEPVRPLLVLGAVAIAAERGRPEHVRPLALLFAVAAMTCFAVRDDLVRALHAHANPEVAAAATFVGGVLVTSLWARRLPRRTELRRLAPAGLLFGLSYVAIFEAYFRGRVSVVS